MLQKLKKVAQMAIAMSTGKKINFSEIQEQRQSSSNVIAGFAYALDDMFENQDIDMNNIVKKETPMDSSSPFRSPKKGKDGLVPKKKKKWKTKKEEEPVGPPT